MGVVTGMDITHDPGKGLDSQQLAEALVQSKDPRIKYIISNRHICSGSDQDKPAWVWRDYPVPPHKNPHNHHVHISVKPDKALYDSTQAWGLANVAPPGPGHVPGNTRPTVRRGSTGDAVRRVQELLGLPIDGRFDATVDAAVKAAQERAGIVADGVVSAQTWELLERK
jgi:peptidoglycan hydrolase-like protein with peptidoglycan-binding domain